MKLFEIREYLIKHELSKPNCKEAAREFLCGMSDQYQIALTLTLNQKWFTMNGLMRVDHYLTKEDIPKIYERFEYKLNKLIWKQKFYRHHSEKLKFLKGWEDGNGKKRIHLHAALGNFPKDFKWNTLPKIVAQSSKECFEIDFQHKEP